jgi:hypothetical protein
LPGDATSAVGSSLRRFEPIRLRRGQLESRHQFPELTGVRPETAAFEVGAGARVRFSPAG